MSTTARQSTTTPDVAAAAAGRVFSFAPLARADARVLILGSMPGKASLAAGRYYAHPRNAFWPIVASVFGFDAAAPYAERAAALQAAGVALWDVLAACARTGSLDSAIERDSEQPNDISGFLAAHPLVHTIGFNGQKAAEAFRRHVGRHVGDIDRAGHTCRLVRLPSTSPAHAGMSLADKQAAWAAALGA